MNIVPEPSIQTNLYSGSFVIQEVFDATKDYILFVHGWNNDALDKQLTMQTMVKSLYWLGYEGGLGLLDWPTFYDAEGGKFHEGGTEFGSNYTYTPSEYNALRSGAPLRNLLQELGPNTTLVAHSMGNVVAAEALRLWSTVHETPLVKSYVAMQAAIPASAYGDLTEPDNPSFDLREYGLNPSIANFETFASLIAGASEIVYTDKWANLMVNAQSAAGQWFNYYQPLDMALDIAWWVNNGLKPSLGNPERGGTLAEWWAANISPGIDLFTRPTSIWEYDYRWNGTDYQRFVWEYVPGEHNFDGSWVVFNPVFNLDWTHKHYYEYLAFLSQSQTKPMGTRRLPENNPFQFTDQFDIRQIINPVPSGVDPIPLPGGDRHTDNHSFQFYHDMPTVWKLWDSILVQSSVQRLDRS